MGMLGVGHAGSEICGRKRCGKMARCMGRVGLIWGVKGMKEFRGMKSSRDITRGPTGLAIGAESDLSIGTSVGRCQSCMGNAM